MLQRLLPLALFFLAGYLLKRLGIFRKEDSAPFGKLLMSVIIPLVIVRSFSVMELRGELLLLPLAGSLTVLALLLLGALCARLLRLEGPSRGALVVSFGTLEGGLIGYPLLLSARGEEGLSLLVLFDLGNVILLFSLVYVLSRRLGEGSGGWGSSLLRLLRTPLLWAVIVGLSLNALGLRFALLDTLFESASKAMLLIMMILLGLELELRPAAFKLPVLAFLLKLLAGLGVGFGLAGLFGLHGAARAAVVVGAALPPSLIALLYAEESRLDKALIASLLSVAYPLSLLVLGGLLELL